MLILHFLRLLRAAARAPVRRPKAGEAFVRLDYRTLADVGIRRGAILSLAGQVGFDRLRDPPHL